MTELRWIEGDWVVRVHQSGGFQRVTFDEEATVGNRAYSIKQQGASWVLIRAVDDLDDRYGVFGSVDAAKQQAEAWEHVARHPAVGAAPPTNRFIVPVSAK